MANDDLRPLFKDLSGKLKRLRKDIKELVGEVTKLRKTNEEGFDAVQGEIAQNTQAQAELKLMEHMSEVQSIKPQIRAEQTQIEEEKAELDSTLRAIGERYREKHDDLDRTAEEQVRDLGEHIFEIEESEFTAGVEEPFVDHVTTTWHDLQAHNEQAQQERASRLRSAYADAQEAIDGFVDRRDDLLSRIDSHRTDVFADRSEPDQIQVPFYVVTVERDGVEERTVVVPSELRETGDGWYGAELADLDGFREPMEYLAGHPPRESFTRMQSASDLRGHVEEHGDSGVAGQLSFGDAFEKAMPDSVTVKKESGGD